MKYIVAALLLAFAFNVAAPIRTPEVASERLCKAVALYEEARGESLHGQRAVLDVVHARMWKSGRSACEIIKQHKQFSFYTGQRLKYVGNSLTTYQLVATMPPVLTNATHYHATRVRPAWAKRMKRLAVIGKHVFYQQGEKR
jgi:spore germination cell wall hydrolase CwlJ-like protein